jgi:N-acylneuraminate cytidylyltransferase
VPRKNLALVGGIPLVGRAVRAALSAPSVTQVIVSTDDMDIATAAKAHGAGVLMRPPEISGDTASSESALLHALDRLRERNSTEPDIIVFIQCTSPLVKGEDIERAIETLISTGADCAFTATEFHGFVWRETGSGQVEAVNHEHHTRLRRQERETQWLENGAVYVMRTKGFLESRHRFFGKIVNVPMPVERSLEVDSPNDLMLVRHTVSSMPDVRSMKLPLRIDAVVMDFDGVFTDNTVFVLQDGREAVRCSRADGLGLEMMRDRGIPMLVLSSETNPVVRARCDKLGLACLSGSGDKKTTLEHWAQGQGYSLDNIVYLGNDMNDVPALKIAGCPVVVADAHPAAMAHAAMILNSRGGHGAIRELCDLILNRTEV